MTSAGNRLPSPTDIYLGQQIRRIRLLHGLSQEVVADACGVAFQQLQKYENGMNRVSASRLFEIAKVLRCDVVDLYPVDGAVADRPDEIRRVQNSAVNAELYQLVPHMTAEQRKTLLLLANTFVTANKND